LRSSTKTKLHLRTWVIFSNRKRVTVNTTPVPEFIDPFFAKTSTNKTLVFNQWKRAFWACFRENWVYKFGHGNISELHIMTLVLHYTCYKCHVDGDPKYIALNLDLTLYLGLFSISSLSRGAPFILFSF
jgi:hypothetical protein